MSELRIIPADEAKELREELRAIRETPILRGRQHISDCFSGGACD